MEGKSIENRIYQIIIICLLVVLVVILAKGQTAHYQISGNHFLDTRTGEVYVLESIQGEQWMWGYIGKPRKTINYEDRLNHVIKNIEQRR
jgi:hypothetical protein